MQGGNETLNKNCLRQNRSHTSFQNWLLLKRLQSQRVGRCMRSPPTNEEEGDMNAAFPLHAPSPT